MDTSLMITSKLAKCKWRKISCCWSCAQGTKTLRIGVLSPQSDFPSPRSDVTRTGWGTGGVGGEPLPEAYLQRVAGIRLAVDAVNANDDLLPGWNITLFVADAQNTEFEGRVLIQTLDLLSVDVHAIICCWTSTATIRTQLLLRSFRVPQVSPYSTSDLLSASDDDGYLYPYLVRTLASNYQEAFAMLSLMKLPFEWRRAAVLSDPSVYGTGLVDKLESIAPGRGITLTPVIRDVNEASASAAIQQVIDSGSRIVLLLCLPDLTAAVLEAAVSSTTQEHSLQWLVNSWSTVVLPLSSLPTPLGIVGFIPDHGRGTTYDEFQDAWASRSPEQDRYGYNYSSAPELDSYVTFGYDAVLAVAHAAHGMLVGNEDLNSSLSGDSLMAGLRNVTFQGVTGKVSFKEDGGRSGMLYRVLNKQVATANQSLLEMVYLGSLGEAQSFLSGGAENSTSSAWMFSSGEQLTWVPGDGWYDTDDLSVGAQPPWDGVVDVMCMPGLVGTELDMCKLPAEPEPLVLDWNSRTGTKQCPCRDHSSATIIVIGHGTNIVWSMIEDGALRAGQDLGVQVHVRTPTTKNDLRAMYNLILEAVAENPAGIAVSLPDAELLGGAVQEAIDAGIPVVSFNSGSEHFEQLGSLAHFGMPEYTGGYEACRELAALGATNVLIVNHEGHTRNVALMERSEGCQDAVHATVAYLVEGADARAQQLYDSLTNDVSIDGILVLSASGMGDIHAALELMVTDGVYRNITSAVFDNCEEAGQLIQQGRIQFLVDQQPYLQGYLPVVHLALLSTTYYQMQPSYNGGFIHTGPVLIREEQVEAKKCETYGVNYCNEPAVGATLIPEQSPDCACIDKARFRIIAVMHRAAMDKTSRILIESLAQAASDQGIALEVYTPSTHDSVSEGLKLLQDAIAAAPDGLLSTAPTQEYTNELRRASVLGIKVMTFQSSVNEIPADLLFVGVEARQAGIQAGDLVRSAIDARGLVDSVANATCTVLCVEGGGGEDLGLLRKCEGVNASLTSAGAFQMSVVHVHRNSILNSETTVRNAYLRESQHRAVCGMVALGPEELRASLLVLEGLILEGHVEQASALPVIGVGLSEEIVADLESEIGLAVADLIFDGEFLQGYLSVVLLAQAVFHGNSIAESSLFIETGPAPADMRPEDLLAQRCFVYDWEPCSGDCPDGHFMSSEDSCQACPPGYFNARVGDTIGTVCDPCNPGVMGWSLIGHGLMGVHNVSPGEYQDEAGATACKVCPKGEYQPEAGADACLPCPRGHYNPFSGQVDCIECMPNSLTSSDGAFRKNDCLCKSGYEQRIDDAGNATCAMCSSMTVKPLPGPQACTICPDATFAANAINASSGAYMLDPGLSTPVCTCSAGKQPLLDANASWVISDQTGDCEACPSDTRYTSPEAVVHYSQSAMCEPCPLGWYFVSSLLPCEPCPPHTLKLFSSADGVKSGMAQCTPCNKEDGSHLPGVVCLGMSTYYIEQGYYLSDNAQWCTDEECLLSRVYQCPTAAACETPFLCEGALCKEVTWLFANMQLDLPTDFDQRRVGQSPLSAAQLSLCDTDSYVTVVLCGGSYVPACSAGYHLDQTKSVCVECPSLSAVVLQSSLVMMLIAAIVALLVLGHTHATAKERGSGSEEALQDIHEISVRLVRAKTAFSILLGYFQVTSQLDFIYEDGVPEPLRSFAAMTFFWNLNIVEIIDMKCWMFYLGSEQSGTISGGHSRVHSSESFMATLWGCILTPWAIMLCMCLLYSAMCQFHVKMESEILELKWRRGLRSTFIAIWLLFMSILHSGISTQLFQFFNCSPYEYDDEDLDSRDSFWLRLDARVACFDSSWGFDSFFVGFSLMWYTISAPIVLCGIIWWFRQYVKLSVHQRELHKCSKLLRNGTWKLIEWESVMDRSVQAQKFIEVYARLSTFTEMRSTQRVLDRLIILPRHRVSELEKGAMLIRKAGIQLQGESTSVNVYIHEKDDYGDGGVVSRANFTMLDDDINKKMFGQFTDAFEDEFYFWQCWEIIRRLLLSGFVVGVICVTGSESAEYGRSSGCARYSAEQQHFV
ncbi:hypothetical protein CYMTET_26695 [Cymbomonas tetramitiformis]|uniref:Receptor ligand binding region domain-containing protein n=1 Tax=Cymbomonas tetramitiformis TaxID=36881 RepID=A0AAE0FR80_9CHLO|nr:hypothetical protein CYMTET_26695 [Cymbomonas tetramitiformis]